MILLGVSIISSFSNLTLTGNVIGISYSSYLSLVSILSFVLGVILILATKKIEKWSELEKILLGKTNSSKLPVFSDVEEGIKNSNEISPFLAYTASKDLIYCVYVKTKEDAANIANYLVRGRRLYEDMKAAKAVGSLAKSMDPEKLKGVVKFKCQNSTRL